MTKGYRELYNKYKEWRHYIIGARNVYLSELHYNKFFEYCGKVIPYDIMLEFDHDYDVEQDYLLSEAELIKERLKEMKNKTTIIELLASDVKPDATDLSYMLGYIKASHDANAITDDEYDAHMSKISHIILEGIFDTLKEGLK